LQLDAAGLFLVVLGQVFVFGNIDGVFDGVVVVGQADGNNLDRFGRYTV
jgi:hypothetical protein